MTTLKQRLMEIAQDQKQELPAPNRYFEGLLGLSSGRITQLFEEGSIAKLGAGALANLTKMGYSADWVRNGKLPKMSSPGLVVPGDNRLPIRRALFKLSAGVSGYEVEYENGDSEPIFMGKRWFEQRHYNFEKLIAVKVTGRSMEPNLVEGDLVVINTEDVALKDGEVFAANYDGELVIKRLKREAGQWYLSSDNQDKTRFGDKICGDGCGLIGRIVYRQTEVI